MTAGDQSSGGGQGNPLQVNTNFKLVFICVMILTILFAAGSIVVAFQNRGANPDESLKELGKGLMSLATLGFGAMVGLLGGRASA